MNLKTSILSAFVSFALTCSARAQIQDPNSGHWYEAVISASPVDWDQANAEASLRTFLGMNGHLATISDQSENDFVDTTTPVAAWIGGWQDPNDPGFSEPGGGWVWVTGEPMSFTNWNPGEPSNSGGIEDHMTILQSPFDGRWNDEGQSDVFTYVIEYEPILGAAYCFGDDSGTACPCSNAGNGFQGCRNSGGDGGVLLAGGSSSASADDLVCHAANLIPSQPALLFVGEEPLNGGNGIVFGDGLRCAGTQVIRLGVALPDALGQGTWGPGLGVIGGWSPGEMRYFQGWYRDPVGGPCNSGFNLTNGVELTIAP